MTDQSGERIHILHVDDDPQLASLTTSFLERENDRFTTATLTDPTEAVEQLDTVNPDCVISDYEMPTMDGIELLRAIRDEYPELPVILFTGKGSEEIASEAISVGVTDYLQKGSGSEQYQLLANRIENAVAQYRSARRAEQQERMLSLLQRFNQEIVAATSRTDIERAVTSLLAAEEPYVLAWIGRFDAERDRIVPDMAAGKLADQVGPQRIAERDEQPDRGIRDAIEASEITVIPDRAPTLELWSDEGASLEYEGVLVVPIEYQTDPQGVVVLYTEDSEIVTEAELEMFDELAGDLGQALHTAETTRTLKRHQSAITAIPDGVLVLDEQAEIVLANEPAAGLINRTPEEIQGLPFPTFVEEDIVNEDVIEWYVNAVKRLLSSDSDEEAARYETTIYPVGSDPRTIEVNITLRPYEEEFRGTVGILRDITARKRRQQALKESRKRYRRIVEEAPVAIAMYDADGTLVYVNDAAVDLVGATEKSAVLDRSALAYVHDDDRDRAEQRIRSVLEEQVPTAETELTLVDTSGQEKFVQLRSVPVSHDDAPAGQVVIKDITELKERETDLQRQRDRLDEFASFVSHDLRNPLEVMRGRLELAAEETNNTHVETAKEAQERMATLIESFLQFARNDESDLDVEPTNMRTIAEEAWLHVSTDDVDLVIDGDHDLQGDPHLLRDLFENLFSNAIEHGDSIDTITVGPLSASDGFYVADDGVGIAEEQVNDVFEYGYSTAAKGSGLGLAIVKRISDVHGWNVTLKEGKEGGARFQFTTTGPP